MRHRRNRGGARGTDKLEVIHTSKILDKYIFIDPHVATVYVFISRIPNRVNVFCLYDYYAQSHLLTACLEFKDYLDHYYNIR